MSEELDTDVIVVGAGPTGLLLASELELAGVRVVVVEREEQRTGQSKALNLQPRSAEILELRGWLEPLRERALDLMPGGHFAGLPVLLDYRPLGTRHPYQVGIPQARVEQFLEDRLVDREVVVRRGHELTGLGHEADRVTATLTRPDGTTCRLRGRYLVGCDGAHSTVRKLSGIPFPGRDGRVSAVVCDVELTATGEELPTRWELPSLVPRNKAIVTLHPLGEGVFRMLFTGPAQLAAPRDAPVTDEEVRTALHAWYGSAVTLRSVHWASRFTDANRQVERYRDGRLLLAGDAAHIHSPTGGQGMNLGLQDAFNLGWKLAATVTGRAPADLLDSYHAERHPVAAAVLANTRAQGVLLAPDEDVARLRGLFVDLMRLPETNRHLAGMISGLSIRYDLPDGGGHPLVGCRMPDIDLVTADGPITLAGLMHAGRGLLLELAGPAGGPTGGPAGSDGATRPADVPLPPGVDRVSAKAVEELATTAVLIRPDGYVAWAATPDGGSPAAALTRWFGAP